MAGGECQVEDGRFVSPALRDHLHGIETEADDEIGRRQYGSLGGGVGEQAGAQRVGIGENALGLVGRQDGTVEPAGQFPHGLLAGGAPGFETGEQHRPACGFEKFTRFGEQIICCGHGLRRLA